MALFKKEVSSFPFCITVEKLSQGMGNAGKDKFMYEADKLSFRELKMISTSGTRQIKDKIQAIMLQTIVSRSFFFFIIQPPRLSS